MIVTLDRLASRYKVLPSQAIESATTFDLYVMDVALRYEIVAQQKRDGTYVKPVPKLTEEEMLLMIDKVRNPYDYDD